MVNIQANIHKDRLATAFINSILTPALCCCAANQTGLLIQAEK